MRSCRIAHLCCQEFLAHLEAIVWDNTADGAQALGAGHQLLLPDLLQLLVVGFVGRRMHQLHAGGREAVCKQELGRLSSDVAKNASRKA